MQPSPESTPESSGDTSTEPSNGSSGASTGASAIALDKRTEVWFTTLCGTFTQFINEDTPKYDANTGIPAQKAAAVQYYAKVGTALSAASGVLKVLPTPTIAGGDQLSATVVTAFGAAGKSAAQQSAAIATASSPAELEKALTDADTALSKEIAALNGVSSVMTQPGLRPALAKIPACAPLMGG